MSHIRPPYPYGPLHTKQLFLSKYFCDMGGWNYFRASLEPKIPSSIQSYGGLLAKARSSELSHTRVECERRKCICRKGVPKGCFIQANDSDKQGTFSKRKVPRAKRYGFFPNLNSKVGLKVEKRKTRLSTMAKTNTKPPTAVAHCYLNTTTVSINECTAYYIENRA